MSHDPNNPDCPWNQPTPTGTSTRCNCKGPYVPPDDCGACQPDVCEACGHEVEREDAKLCDRCWHVQTDLGDYLKSPAGWAFVLETLRERAAQMDMPWPPTE